MNKTLLSSAEHVGDVDYTLVTILLVVLVICLCACGVALYKCRIKYEIVNFKLKVRESYLKKQEETQRKLQEFRRNHKGENPNMINSAILPVAFNVYSPTNSQRSQTS